MTDDLHSLAGAYALDALDPAERREFEAHYPTCEICVAEVAEFREVAGAIAAAEATTPAADLRERTMAEIARTPQLPPAVGPVVSLEDRRTRRWIQPGLAAAAALVLVVGLFAFANRDNASSTQDLVAAPDATVSTLESSDVNGALQIVWSAERDQVAIIGSDLDDPGSGMAYALWFVRGDQVQPAALFAPDDNGDIAEVLDIDNFDPQGWGITVEPSAGSAQPTTPILFSGTI